MRTTVTLDSDVEQLLRERMEREGVSFKRALAQPSVQIVQPTARHAEVLSGLLVRTPAAGVLVTDAHLAALAIEHRATVVTYDSDFERFAGVRFERPGR